MAHKVRVGSRYRYHPVGWDLVDPPVGALDGILAEGDIVKVVNLYGCPKANTMGMCYINTLNGTFLGLVHTGSLLSAP